MSTAEPRTINHFHEIPWHPSLFNKMYSDMISITLGYNVMDMKEVLENWIALSRHMELKEILDDQEKVQCYLPQISITVTMANALEVQRQLVSCVMLLYAAMLNENFQVEWGSSFEQKGIFGITYANRYLVIDRGATSLDVYEDLLKTMMNKLTETQKWYVSRL